MQNKLRQLIASALKRNEFTATLSLNIAVKGYNVMITGEVESDFLISEVVATVESVSPYLNVYQRLTVAETHREAVFIGALH